MNPLKFDSQCHAADSQLLFGRFVGRVLQIASHYCLILAKMNSSPWVAYSSMRKTKGEFGRLFKSYVLAGRSTIPFIPSKFVTAHKLLVGSSEELTNIRGS